MPDPAKRRTVDPYDCVGCSILPNPPTQRRRKKERTTRTSTKNDLTHPAGKRRAFEVMENRLQAESEDNAALVVQGVRGGARRRSICVGERTGGGSDSRCVHANGRESRTIKICSKLISSPPLSGTKNSGDEY